MWDELKQFVEANVSPEMMFGYWTVGTYLAFGALLLLFLPMHNAPGAGAVKKSSLAMAANVLVWCGYLGPCLLANTKNPAFATDALLVSCLPDSPAFLLGMVVLGFVLLWYSYSVEARLHMLLAGCFVTLLEPLILFICFPIFLILGLLLELFLGPLLMLLFVLRLLYTYHLHRKIKKIMEERCRCHFRNGRDGSDGRDGRDGTPGPRGKDGEKGEKGGQGEKGERGSRGRDGRDGRNGGRRPSPPVPPAPVPPEPGEPDPAPQESETTVAVRALVLSGGTGSKTYTPDAGTKRTFILSGQAVESMAGGGNYPTIIGSFNASACGRVWTFLPTLSADWQMLNNERPMGALNVLRAGDTLTLQRTDSPHPAATLRVSFRMLLVSHRNG